MSYIRLIENLVFWTIVIAIAFLGRGAPNVLFSLLSYIIVYYILREIFTGASSATAFYTFNIIFLLCLALYIGTGYTPVDVLRGLSQGILSIPKYI